MDPTSFNRPFLSRKDAFLGSPPSYDKRIEPPKVTLMGPPPPKRQKINRIESDTTLPIQPNTQLVSALPSFSEFNLPPLHAIIEKGQFVTYLLTGRVDNRIHPPNEEKVIDERLLSLTKKAIKEKDVFVYKAICSFLNRSRSPFCYQDFVKNPSRLPAMQDLLEETFNHPDFCQLEIPIAFKSQTIEKIHVNEGMDANAYPLLSLLEDIFAPEIELEDLDAFMDLLKLLHCGKITITSKNVLKLFRVLRTLKKGSFEKSLLEEKLLEWILSKKNDFSIDLDELSTVLSAIFHPTPSLEGRSLNQALEALPESLSARDLENLLKRHSSEAFMMCCLTRYSSQASHLEVMLRWFREETNLLNKKFWAGIYPLFDSSESGDIEITMSEAAGVANKRRCHLSILSLKSQYFRTYQNTGFRKSNSLKMFEILGASEEPKPGELAYNSFAAGKILEFCYHGPLTTAFLEESLSSSIEDDDIPFLMLAYADILAIDSFKEKLTEMIDGAFTSDPKDLLNVSNSQPLSLGSNESDSGSLDSPKVNYRSKNLLRRWLPALLFFKPEFKRAGSVKGIVEFILDELKRFDEVGLKAFTNQPIIAFLHEHVSYLKSLYAPKESSLDFIKFLITSFNEIEEIRLQEASKPVYDYLRANGWKKVTSSHKPSSLEVTFIKGDRT